VNIYYWTIAIQKKYFLQIFNELANMSEYFNILKNALETSKGDFKKFKLGPLSTK
jgi:hypothetical protein